MNSTTAAIILASITAALTACDAAIVGDCAIIPVGAQANSEDWDLDGKPDHPAFVVAKLKGDCTAAALASANVAMFETSPGQVLHGYANEPVMLSKSCAMWTWGSGMSLPGGWAVLITPPVKGQSVGVYSSSIGDLPPGAALPVWRDGIGEAWTARLPYGLPTGCVQ